MVDELFFNQWAEFKEYISDDLFNKKTMHREKYLFRGHGNSEWSLCSSFDRAFEEFENEERDKLEEFLIENFKKECESDDSYMDVVENEISLLALAQHNGLPTRLLDWTESPYIAAFFAFQGHFYDSIYKNIVGHSVAIWILDKESFIWSEKRGVQIISPSTWKNDRLRSQYGWFTLSRTPFRSLEEYVDQFPNQTNSLRKLILPVDQAELAISDLDLMGINYSKLFTALEGSARAAVTKTLLQMRAE